MTLLRCGICGKKIEEHSPKDPASSILISVGQERYEVGVYHLSCLIKRLKKLIEGKET